MSSALLMEAEPLLPTPPPDRAGPEDQRRLDRARMRTVAVVVVGLLIGALASYGRTDAAGSLRPLLQSVALWMVAPFVLGALMRTRRGGVYAGLACSLLQLGGYAGVCAARGVGAGDHLLLVGAVVSVLGGPLYGAAGHVWRKASPGVRGLGPAALAAVFVAEGAWRDVNKLGAVAGGSLWIAVGVAIAAVTLRSWCRARWLLATLPVVAIGEIVLTQCAR